MTPADRPLVTETVLEQRLRRQSERCARYGSPLTSALLQGAADDLAAGGVVADLLAPYVDEPSGSVVSLRFAGALHRLVLERSAPELALHYPSVGGTAPVADVWPAAERACQEHRERLRELVTRPVQTNEVGRSAALYGVLLMLGGPIRLLEVGASAGLNLRCDSYAYEHAGTVYGDPRGELRLAAPWISTPPIAPHPPEVVARKGCDPRPIDPATQDGRLTLTSYVWADQTTRLDRLRMALRTAERVPAHVEAAGALEFLSRELAQAEPGVTTVVWHSVVWQYVDPAERAAVEALLERAGAQRPESSPLVRASLEPERVGSGADEFRVLVQRWPDGERVHVADALGHGPPVRWLGASL